MLGEIMLKEINFEEFEQILVNNDKPFIVDIFAPWCGPCKVLTPILEQIAVEMEEVDFFKINSDDNQDIAMKYNVQGIPTILFFDKDRNVTTHTGVLPKAQLEEKIRSLI